MRVLCISLLAPLLVAASPPALADDVADERARLANTRIQLEEERRAREEAERLRQAASETAAAEQAASAPAIEDPAAMAPAIEDQVANTPVISDSSDAAGDASVNRMEMSRALEQLRELGALRDAGYLDEQEFEQLKKKIIDAAL